MSREIIRYSLDFDSWVPQLRDTPAVSPVPAVVVSPPSGVVSPPSVQEPPHKCLFQYYGDLPCRSVVGLRTLKAGADPRYYCAVHANKLKTETCCTKKAKNGNRCKRTRKIDPKLPLSQQNFQCFYHKDPPMHV